MDQAPCATTGYTNPTCTRVLSAKASTFIRSATAPETIVADSVETEVVEINTEVEIVVDSIIEETTELVEEVVEIDSAE